MEGFFTQEVIERTRLLVLDGTRIENPTFYAQLQYIGFKTLPNFSTMAAITFDDVVVSHQPFTNGLLFNELVHVEQYRQLGIPNAKPKTAQFFTDSELIPVRLMVFETTIWYTRTNVYLTTGDLPLS
jgi:hypothetical protein